MIDSCCPRCKVETVSVGGRLTCMECGWVEPLWLRDGSIRRKRLPLLDKLLKEEEEQSKEAEGV